MNTCPVCGYDKLKYPARDYTICPSCGTEFGYHDTSRTFEELRISWMARGMQWHSLVVSRPLNWKPVAQLLAAGLLPVVNKASSEMSRSEARIGGARLRLQFSGAA
jgi:hypothetical protein